MSQSPRAFSRRESFDAPLFLRTAYLQPALIWLALALLAGPASRAVLRLLGASCVGPARDGATAAAFIAYVLFVPGLGAALWFFAYARRRLQKSAHRWIADLSMAVVLAVSATNSGVIALQIARRWPALAPDVSRMRDQCRPGR